MAPVCRTRRLLALFALGLALLLGTSLVRAPLARAQDTPAATPNTLDDPLAWRHLDLDAANQSITVADRATGKTRTIAGRQIVAGSREMYLRSATLADVVQASRLWQAPTQRLTLVVQDVRLRVMAGSRLVVQGESELLLPVPVVAAEGDLWLPVVFVTEVLGPRTGQSIAWDPDARRLTLGTIDASITGLRVTQLTRAANLQITCRAPLSFRATSPEPGTIELKIYDGVVDPSRVAMGEPRGLVRSVHSRQADGYAVVIVRVDDLVTQYRTSTADDGRTITLTVEEQQTTALPEPVPRGQARVAFDTGPINVSRALTVQTVVIDPGHGGNDAGVAGPGGTQEKTINLEMARQLASYLRREGGLNVVLTRDSDEHVPLAQRTEIANSAGGDLFISLHCNGWFSQGATGLETYFLSPAKTDWSQSVEVAENGDGGDDDVDFIVWELVQNRFISSSSDLAETIQHTVSDRLNLPDRGVRQAGFRVLVGAYMPAVLVEMGFLSNPSDETRLNDSHYQHSLAGAIGDAILQYRDRMAEAASQGAAAGGGGR